MKKALLTTALLAGLSAQAAQPSFNLLEAGINKYDQDNSTRLSGSFEINNNIYGVASYEFLTEESNDIFGDTDIDQFTIGLGYKMDLNEDTSLFGQFEYGEVSFKNNFVDESEDGYLLTVGMRSMVAENTEVFGQITHSNSDVASQTIVGFGARQWFTENVGAYVRYDRNDYGDDSYGLGVSVSF